MKIALIGYGKMGRMIEEVARSRGFEIAERFEVDRPLRSDRATRCALQDVEVLVDFSVPQAVLKNIQACVDLSIPLVEGTTGWHQHVDKARDMILKSDGGMVYASNFSLGIHLFYKMVEYAGEIFKSFDMYDPFIEESHHKMKKDAPSGTALVLKNILEKKYKKREIPVTSVRAGYIPGKHAVSFDSTVDTVCLEHTTRTREGFAEGALLAVQWIAGRRGFYEFQEVLEAFLRERK